MAHSPFHLEGRVAVVTGGAKNIGRSIALALARDARAIPVILYGSDTDAASKMVSELEELGISGGAYQVDIKDVAAVREVIVQVERDFGRIDILVNNAAVRPSQKISEITLEDWDAVIATNLRAPFFLSQAVLPGMVKRGWGRIINIGGLDAYWGKPRRAHNVSAKLGLAGLSRAMANEVARFGVTVNVVVPGTTDTYRHSPEWYPEIDRFYEERKQRIPMGRLGRAEEVSQACLFLASEQASYTTGQELFVSGGAFPMVRQPADEYPADEF